LPVLQYTNQLQPRAQATLNSDCADEMLNPRPFALNMYAGRQDKHLSDQRSARREV
jgi:hypothetical protein